MMLRLGLKGLRTEAVPSSLLPLLIGVDGSSGGRDPYANELHVGPPSNSPDTISNVWISV